MPQHIAAGLAKRGLFVAATTIEVDGDSSRIQLFPYGEFRATDGRPKDVPHWIIADKNGADICTVANDYKNKIVIDYEHQTLRTQENGQPAPAAGWMDYFYLTPKGVFAEVTWTEKAKAMIAAGEYKYISPVFAYDKDGYVRKIFNAALTNDPALDGMEEVIAACSERGDFTETKPKTEPKPTHSEELMLELLIALLGLSPDATEAQATAALKKLKQTAEQSNIGVNEAYDEIAALTAKLEQDPDPAKYVPLEVVKDLQTQVAALTKQINDDKANDLITAALAAGKLLPAQKDWAIALCAKDPQALSDYLATVEPVAALTKTQTADSDPDAAGDDVNAGLSPEQLAVCKSLDIAPDEFKKTLTED